MDYFHIFFFFIIISTTLSDSKYDVQKDTQMVGVATIDRNVPLFYQPMITLGSVSLTTKRTASKDLKLLIIRLPYRNIELILPSDANVKHDVMFDHEDDRQDVVRVEIKYLHYLSLYHGFFHTYRSKVNFIYDPDNKNNNNLILSLKLLWKK